MSEELLFRGYLFGQLYRRAGWPFWAAALVNAVPFVAGHFDQLSGKGWEFVVSVAEVLLLVGVSALFAAWVYVRWEYNLWVLIFIHALLNFYSTTFAMSETSGFSWVDNVAWLMTLILVVLEQSTETAFRSWLIFAITNNRRTEAILYLCVCAIVANRAILGDTSTGWPTQTDE
jgi:membrane protease YdiL (CAAX protease family)